MVKGDVVVSICAVYTTGTYLMQFFLCSEIVQVSNVNSSRRSNGIVPILKRSTGSPVIVGGHLLEARIQICHPDVQADLAMGVPYLRLCTPRVEICKLFSYIRQS